MNVRTIFCTFSGLIFSLVLCSLAQKVNSEETINIGPLCYKYNGTVSLKEYNSAFVEYDEHWPFDCEILIVSRSRESVVISFYEWYLTGNDELVIKDRYTELSLKGTKDWYGEKSFIFKGDTTIQLSTNDTVFKSFPSSKFKLVFTLSNGDYPRCDKNDFVCNNKICLSDHKLVCDVNNNCGDWSDEIDCVKMCTSGEFECANSKCIPKYKLCNGRNDCGDMSDEEMCNRDCRLGKQFKCSNSMCISSQKVCDNTNDCGDWSDEINCHRECDSLQFPCRNKKCIDNWKVCNGNNDCGDMSDENKCRFCSSLEFLCSNGLCIPKNMVCNNRNDCGDSSDEKHCNLAGGNDLEVKNSSMNPWYIAITICAVLLAIVVVTFFSILIKNRVADKKKKTRNQLRNSSHNSGVHHVQPPNLMERFRQSFRSGRQTASPSTRPPGDVQPTSVNSEPQTLQVPSMYPQLQSSVNSIDVHNVQPPNLLERVRQSFRSGRQSAPSSIQPSNQMYSGPVTTGDLTYQVPSMYPQLQSGFDNPEFKIEE